MRADTFDKQIGLLAYLLQQKVNPDFKKNTIKPPEGFKNLACGRMYVALTPGRFHSTIPGGGFLK